MAKEKKYWKGLEDLTNSPVAQKMRDNEFAEDLPTDKFLGDKEKLEKSSTSRRDFLKYMGFSTAAATLASCEAPITHSIPYVTAPEEVIPGIATYYATTYFDGHDYASVLLRTREGRPIKVEPNKMSVINASPNARVQASVLNLYDSYRLQVPMVKGEFANWSDVDKGVKAGLQAASGSGKQVVLLSSTMISPSAKKLVEEFGGQYNNFRHVTYDAFSYSEKLDAIEEATGRRALPSYRFDKADVVVGFNADFLAEFLGQSVAADYAKRRVPGADMNRHLHFETNMTNTGANADQRFKIKPSEVGPALTVLHNELSGGNMSAKLNPQLEKAVKMAAKELKKAGKNGLVVTGTNDKNIETLAFSINQILGNSGTTVDYDKRSNLRKGNDREMKQLIKDMNAGKVGGLIIYNMNAAYNLSGNKDFTTGLSKVDTSVYFSQKDDETAQLVKYVCAENNYLESWGDAEPVDGVYSLQQPTISRLFNTRQMEECLMVWMDKSGLYRDYLKQNWEGILGGSNWDEAVHDGVFPSMTNTTGGILDGRDPSGKLREYDAVDKSKGATKEAAGDGIIASIFGSDDDTGNEATASRQVDVSSAAAAVNKTPGEEFEIMFYQKAGAGIGNLANNPWLLEFPDPITRISWDNYLTVSASDALELGVENWSESNGALNGNYVNLTANGQTIENVPILINPGQTPGTVGLAVGYGRQRAGQAADNVGVNAFTLMDMKHHAPVEISPVGGEHEFASVQLAHTLMGRTRIVQETDLNTYLTQEPSTESGDGWNQDIEFETFKGPLGPEATNLWDDFEHEIGHMWNMSIDLNLCNGCGACVIACQSENNVPVVGKDEVRRHRDMHWIRIDRYYSSDMNEEIAEEEGVSAIDRFAQMEIAGENPDVRFQPVMCQHCNHAPCETVCPVIATSHSSEGLNHMTYNRCIGTRYCANNCPYKVRRFNWFQYHGGSQEKFDVNYAMNDELGKMVLNPDVTVRSRGVMEKCSMCIQRIQLGKLEAKKEGHKLEDGAIQTACMSACPTGAIVFGDVNDKDSRVYKLKQDERMYHLLAEVGTQPSVFYQTKVTNRA